MVNKEVGISFKFDNVTIPMNRAALQRGDESLPSMPGSLPMGGTRDIIQPTESGESIRELNKDDIDPGTRQSAIDMNSRLHPIEISAVIAFDVLVGLGILPQKCIVLSRQKKRLSVSLGGRGRQEIVDLVTGKHLRDEKKGMGAQLQSALGGRV